MRSRYGRNPVQFVGYFAALPFLYGLSLLPFALLHRLSDAAAFLAYRVLRLRRRIVLENLRGCFPDASPEEIDRIALGSYRHAFDVTVEVLKQLTTSPDAIAARVDTDLAHAREIARAGRSFVLVTSHSGNWEWAIAAAVRDVPEAILHVIYHPLKHPGFDRLFRRVRERAGCVLTPMAKSLRDIVRLGDRVAGTVLVADQRPRSRGAYPTTFFGRNTMFFRGPERIAVKLDRPVVFVWIERIGRGRYRMRDEVLCAEPRQAADGEIIERIAKRLEEQIRKEPDNWLWTHRRWRDRRAERGEAGGRRESGATPGT